MHGAIYEYSIYYISVFQQNVLFIIQIKPICQKTYRNIQSHVVFPTNITPDSFELYLLVRVSSLAGLTLNMTIQSLHVHEVLSPL